MDWSVLKGGRTALQRTARAGSGTPGVSACPLHASHAARELLNFPTDGCLAHAVDAVNREVTPPGAESQFNAHWRMIRVLGMRRHGMNSRNDCGPGACGRRIQHPVVDASVLGCLVFRRGYHGCADTFGPSAHGIGGPCHLPVEIAARDPQTTTLQPSSEARLLPPLNRTCERRFGKEASQTLRPAPGLEMNAENAHCLTPELDSNLKARAPAYPSRAESEAASPTQSVPAAPELANRDRGAKGHDSAPVRPPARRHDDRPVGFREYVRNGRLAVDFLQQPDIRAHAGGDSCEMCPSLDRARLRPDRGCGRQVFKIPCRKSHEENHR